MSDPEVTINKSQSEEVDEQFFDVEVVVDQKEGKTVVFECPNEVVATKLKAIISNYVTDVREN